MLSYQHLYHAGNAADLHKHMLLAWALAYLTAKPKPLTYVETHAGRGLYDLAAPEAEKTGEARHGIGRIERSDWLAQHPLGGVLQAVRARHGASAYPGSPFVARAFLRPGDVAHLAELHPAEHRALEAAFSAGSPAAVHVRYADGYDMARALLPPTPRRGLMLVDPSYEGKGDYEIALRFLEASARKWPVGVIMLWYPILARPRHLDMTAGLRQLFPDALSSELRFPPAREGHGMLGSGLLVINPPWGMAEEARRIESLLARSLDGPAGPATAGRLT